MPVIWLILILCYNYIRHVINNVRAHCQKEKKTTYIGENDTLIWAILQADSMSAFEQARATLRYTISIVTFTIITINITINSITILIIMNEVISIFCITTIIITTIHVTFTIYPALYLLLYIERIILLLLIMWIRYFIHIRIILLISILQLLIITIIILSIPL